jgi:ATP-dependent Clp protease, protease subunit
MPKKYFSVQNKTDESVDILIYGVIGDSWFEESVTARQFVADLQALEKNYKRINIRINSPGGSVWDGLPIFNAIRNSSAEIHTYNDGLCASMAFVILESVSKENIHWADNALGMIHSASTGAWGNVQDIEQVVDMLKKVDESLITCLESNGSKNRDEIKSTYFDYKDHFLTADEALSEGFAGLIEKGALKISDKITSLTHDEVINQFNKMVKNRTIFDKWFSDAMDFFTPNNFVDMDIKTLRKACGLADNATEQDVLDWIAEHGKPVDQTEEETQEEEESEEEETTEETNTDEKDQEIANLKAQVEALKKAPGAKDKKVSKETDSKSGANDTFKTYTSAREVFDAVNKMFE